MSNLSELTRLLAPLIEDLGYELVGIEHSANPKNAFVRIFIDAEDGIDIDDCERVSRESAALLDVEDPIAGNYNLEVSSPGLDRPLFTPEHFERFAGEEASVTLFSPEEGRRRFKGRILGAEAGRVRMEQDGAEVSFDFENIAKAKLVPDYDALFARDS